MGEEIFFNKGIPLSLFYLSLSSLRARSAHGEEEIPF